MRKLRMVLAALAAASSLVAVDATEAAISNAPVNVDSSLVTPIADGCGPAGWRGPWGHCQFHRGGSYGPGYGAVPTANGCPPGFWRGPWGHCRNTPYHGRLPGGGWR